MRKRIFTVLAALGGLVCVNAADVSNYAELKTALNSSDAEIRVAVGVYTIPVGDGELIIPAGKTVIGGFKGGFGDTDRIYPGAATDKADMTILDGNSLINTVPGAKHRVATVKGTLEGCVIRNGHAHNDNGGGILVDGGMVLNCIIKGNVAMNPTTNDAKGGGAYLQNSGKLINCVVAFNMANNGYGVAGTGDVINNTITANTYAPTAVAVTGGTFKHFKHWRDSDNMPWSTFNPTNDLDGQEITLSNFSLAATETTTSQYAVFTAAMDLKVVVNGTSQEVLFSNTSLQISSLMDPFYNEQVGTCFGFTSQSTDILFQAAPRTDGFSLQLVGKDFIYYPTRSNEAITHVTWNGALAYSLWIGGSLPTEAQWEYAARYNGSGVDNFMYTGTDDISVLNNTAWYSANSSNHVRDVATKTANNIGLFDMTGNVWEWCADYLNNPNGPYPTYTYGTGTTNPIWNTSSSSGRVHRGGGWRHLNSMLSLAYRASGNSGLINDAVGVRPLLIP